MEKKDEKTYFEANAEGEGKREHHHYVGKHSEDPSTETDAFRDAFRCVIIMRQNIRPA